MNEKELAKALLDVDATQLAGGPDPREQTRNIMRRDKFWIRLLVGLTVVLWLAAIIIFYVTLGLFLPYMAESLPSDAAEEMSDAATHMTFAIAFAGSIEALMWAALCTILLVLLMRRATLRQVNASLVEISEQLKQLREDLATGENA